LKASRIRRGRNLDAEVGLSSMGYGAWNIIDALKINLFEWKINIVIATGELYLFGC